MVVNTFWLQIAGKLIRWYAIYCDNTYDLSTSYPQLWITLGYSQSYPQEWSNNRHKAVDNVEKNPHITALVKAVGNRPKLLF